MTEDYQPSLCLSLSWRASSLLAALVEMAVTQQTAGAQIQSAMWLSLFVSMDPWRDLELSGLLRPQVFVLAQYHCLSTEANAQNGVRST